MSEAGSTSGRRVAGSGIPSLTALGAAEEDVRPMTTENRDADRFGSTGRYAALMESLRSRVSRQQFSTWFEPATLESWDGPSLVIGLPNRF